MEPQAFLNKLKPPRVQLYEERPAPSEFADATINEFYQKVYGINTNNYPILWTMVLITLLYLIIRAIIFVVNYYKICFKTCSF